METPAQQLRLSTSTQTRQPRPWINFPSIPRILPPTCLTSVANSIYPALSTWRSPNQTTKKRTSFGSIPPMSFRCRPLRKQRFCWGKLSSNKAKFKQQASAAVLKPRIPSQKLTNPKKLWKLASLSSALLWAFGCKTSKPWSHSNPVDQGRRKKEGWWSQLWPKAITLICKSTIPQSTHWHSTKSL